jgi:hypothetical protein
LSINYIYTTASISSSVFKNASVSIYFRSDELEEDDETLGYLLWYAF